MGEKKELRKMLQSYRDRVEELEQQTMRLVKENEVLQLHLGTLERQLNSRIDSGKLLLRIQELEKERDDLSMVVAKALAQSGSLEGLVDKLELSVVDVNEERDLSTYGSSVDAPAEYGYASGVDTPTGEETDGIS